MDKLHKIGEGAWTVYLYECPRCGSERKLDEEKAKGIGAFTAIGAVTSLIFGTPIVGLLGGIGLAKLAMAGTISGVVAARAIQENYKLILKMNERNLFTCPCCRCTDLVKANEIKAASEKLGSEISSGAKNVVGTVQNNMVEVKESIKKWWKSLG